ncbi:DHA2 family efflux MFS transporter permease subunit [Ferviditalea candida]|uniref:DHA2 family efflux MFS transporter permease subunit n=1 Tax=Ferviditalea candida TaxID=3108399 RepID=A0ABU5ZJ80_9BACL|nr:DHA2 family efflux MFS transporter permease subunit [Paenibacillaceae bacterium T2]
MDKKEEATSSTSSTSSNKGVMLASLVIILAVFMAILDTSIVNVAIPKMMAVFGVNQSQIQWVVTAYALVVGALVPVTGYLGDRFGYKKIFLVALSIFTVGSALCGLAWSNGSMIIFRIVQGLGGGALMPVSMTMMLSMFPPERRGRAMGMFGLSIMFAPAIGPTLSGYITEYSNWRLIFTINVPFGIIDFLLAWYLLKDFNKSVNQRLDIWGLITSSIGMATLLYGVGIVPDKGLYDTEVITFVSIGIISLIAFIIIELNVKEPLLDLRLLKNFTYTLSLIISSIATVILMGSMFLIPVFLQNISHLSSVQTGLVLLPQAIFAGIMMPISGALFDKIGGRILAVTGMLLTSFSLYLTASLDATTSNSTLIFWMVLRSVGTGLMMMPIQTSGMNAIPLNKISRGTALNNTVRQVSSSFGIAWLTLLLTNRQTYHAALNRDSLNQMSTQVMVNLQEITNGFIGLGQSASQAHASAVSYMAGQVQLRSVVSGMDDVFMVTAGLALVGGFLSLFIKRTKLNKGGEKPHVIAE